MEYTKAEPLMVEICQAILEAYHPHLDGVKIAIVCRPTAAKKNGRIVAADTSIPSAKMMPILADEYDFIICIALDVWDRMDLAQRKALMDHELCHCWFDEDAPKIIGHDLEEFACVIQRHGMWRNDGTEEAMQQALLFRQGATVHAPDTRATA